VRRKLTRSGPRGLAHLAKAGVVVLALVALLVVAGSALAANGYEIFPHVFGSGGGRVQAGDYVLDATIGQALVGEVSEGSFELCAGFWCGMGRYKAYLPLVLRNY
jgi:hypothetical protein